MRSQRYFAGLHAPPCSLTKSSRNCLLAASQISPHHQHAALSLRSQTQCRYLQASTSAQLSKAFSQLDFMTNSRSSPANVVPTPMTQEPREAAQRSGSRKVATAAAQPQSAMQLTDTQEISTKLEEQHIGKAVPSSSELVVETSGLATALDLNGSRDGKRKRPRKTAAQGGLQGPATPEMERAPGRAETPNAGALAALARAIRAVKGVPRKAAQRKKEAAAAAAAAEDAMPVIPLAGGSKLRGRRAKTAPSVIEAAVKTEAEEERPTPCTSAVAQQKKGRGNAAGKTAAGTGAETVAVDVSTPVKKPRASRKKPAAVAEDAEAGVSSKFFHAPFPTFILAPSFLLDHLEYFFFGEAGC